MKKIIIAVLFLVCSQSCFAIEENTKVPELSKLNDVKQSFKSHLQKKQNIPESEKNLYKTYEKCTSEKVVIDALEALKGTAGDFSRNAILGNNLSGKPVKVEFANLATINPSYANFDALGWKKKSRLYIYINSNHHDAPKEALAAVLAHEAIHQDELNSLNEETYAWTLEAIVWQQMLENYPEVSKRKHPLVERENLINKLFLKGNYTDEYIRKSVVSNLGYQNLPSRSPGFEDRL